MQTSIRKWGDSAVVIIPAAILEKAGVTLNDTLEVDVTNGCIVLCRPEVRYTLAELLNASPAEAVVISEEDRQWLEDKAAGRTIIEG